MTFNSRPGLAAALGALCAGVVALALHPGAGQAAALSHLNEVRTQSGLVLGSGDEGVVAFKGVAYAAPPVGALRWRPPQPPATWTGTFNADKYGAICMQKYLPKDNGVGALPMSEDCLTLNVWRPMNDGSGRLPVMV